MAGSTLSTFEGSVSPTHPKENCLPIGVDIRFVHVVPDMLRSHMPCEKTKTARLPKAPGLAASKRKPEMPQDFSFATWALCTDTTFGAPP